jgi:hypothetical protein
MITVLLLWWRCVGWTPELISSSLALASLVASAFGGWKGAGHVPGAHAPLRFPLNMFGCALGEEQRGDAGDIVKRISTRQVRWS